MSKASQIRQKAQELLQKGQVEKAIQEYRRLITIESKNPNLYNELGDIFLRASDKDQAVQNYEKAAVIYEKVALYNNAVAVCKKILRVDPEKAETIMKLAELRAKQKLDGEAVSFFGQYVECVLGGSQSLVQRSQRDAERMMELMPSNEGILSKVVKIYSHAGMKIKAIEICVKLVCSAEAEGNGGKATSYRRKIEELKSGLTPEEAAHAAELEGAHGIADAEEKASSPAGEAASSEGDAPGGEPVAEAVDVEPEGAAVAGEGTAETAEAEAEEEETAAAESVTGKDAPAAADEGLDTVSAAEADSNAEDEEAEEPEAPEEAEEPLEAAADGEPRVGEEESAGEPPAEEAEADETPRAPAPRGEELRGEPVAAETAAERPPAQPPREAPRPRIDGRLSPQADSAESNELVEEITSNVEQDDLRSHYDLGMAYLEMGLYTDSIRDFQIASRCEELRVSAMEMIGYCFLKSGQARLAVKQLQRTLEIAGETGADALGIHYNLGLAYEMIGEDAQAREHFEEVYIIDMAFRDVAEKMKKLSTVS